MRNYYDSLYQRSSVKEQPSRDEKSNVELKMPGVHPETVGKLFLLNDRPLQTILKLLVLVFCWYHVEKEGSNSLNIKLL